LEVVTSALLPASFEVKAHTLLTL